MDAAPFGRNGRRGAAFETTAYWVSNLSSTRSCREPATAKAGKRVGVIAEPSDPAGLNRIDRAVLSNCPTNRIRRTRRYRLGSGSGARPVILIVRRAVSQLAVHCRKDHQK